MSHAGVPAGFLTGLLEAEGCFEIWPNNGGTTWGCSVKVALRDDDLFLLEDCCSDSELGHLSWYPARRTSRSQIAWIIQRKEDVSRLAELLAAHPPNGRKRRSVDLWIEAVAIWTSLKSYGIRERRELARLASLLRQERAYDPVAATADGPSEVDLDYLAGFITGEGSFLFVDRKPRFAIHLRADDGPLLRRIADQVGIGSLYHNRAYESSAPSITWTVHRRPELLPLVELLDGIGLRGRKLRQYEAWRPGAVEAGTSWFEGHLPRREVIDASRESLRRASAYDGPCSVLSVEAPHERRRRKHLDALRRWLASCPEDLTCTAYDAQRERGWPNRDTITRTFGSWARALELARSETA